MKIAAFADAHVGSYGKKLDSSKGLNARLLDTYDSLYFVINDAGLQHVETILFAGDMFRGARPTPTELMFAQDALRHNLGGVVLLVGNHDLPRSDGENNALDPLEDTTGHGIAVARKPHVQNWPAFQVACLPYPNRSQLAATIDGYAQMSPDDADRAIDEKLQTILRGLAAQIDPRRPSILLAHISVDLAEPGAERGIMAGRDITIPLSAIPEEFTFVALGHIHRAQDFASYGRPNVFYCGSTDRIDFGEEGQEKSYVLMDLDARTWERVPIPCREYRTVPFITKEGEIRCDDAFRGIDDTICRVRLSRPENVKPDYARIQASLEAAGCWDFRGFVEDVQRVAAVRSEKIARADSIEELLGVWHAAKGCEVPLDSLVAAAREIERSVA